jgi:hypothetical protein
MIHKWISAQLEKIFQAISNKGFTRWGDVIHIIAVIIFACSMCIMYHFLTVFTGILFGIFFGITIMIIIMNIGRYILIDNLLKGNVNARNHVLRVHPKTFEYASSKYLSSVLIIVTIYITVKIVLGSSYLILPVNTFGMKVDLVWVLILNHSLTYINAMLMECFALQFNKETSK